MSTEELDSYAFHVAFEVITLVEQLEYYMDELGHPPFYPASSSPQPEEQAILEASLVHLRLLDEFLGCTGQHPDDVRACDWPGWVARGFLNAGVRRQINAHVAHLSRQRVDGQEWELAELGLACCARMVEFFDSIPHERRRAFDPAPELAERGRQRFTAERSNWTGGE